MNGVTVRVIAHCSSIQPSSDEVNMQTQKVSSVDVIVDGEHFAMEIFLPFAAIAVVRRG
jgi:hypothetical protein